MVEMPLKMTLQSEMIDTLDNATSGAVTMLQEQRISEGFVEFDKPKAEEAVYDLIAETYNVRKVPNPQKLSDSDPSFLLEVPEDAKTKVKSITVDVQFIEFSDKEEIENGLPENEDEPKHKKYVTIGGDSFIQGIGDPPENLKSTSMVVRNDAIAVRMNVEFKKILLTFTEGMNLTRTGVSQARIQNYRFN